MGLFISLSVSWGKWVRSVNLSIGSSPRVSLLIRRTKPGSLLHSFSSRFVDPRGIRSPFKSLAAPTLRLTRRDARPRVCHGSRGHSGLRVRMKAMVGTPSFFVFSKVSHVPRVSPLRNICAPESGSAGGSIHSVSHDLPSSRQFTEPIANCSNVTPHPARCPSPSLSWFAWPLRASRTDEGDCWNSLLLLV